MEGIEKMKKISAPDLYSYGCVFVKAEGISNFVMAPDLESLQKF